MTRFIVGFICVLVLGVMGCSETAGQGGSAGDGGSGGVGGAGGGGVGGEGGMGGEVSFGSLTVSGDVPEWLGTTFVPGQGALVMGKGTIAFWYTDTFESPTFFLSFADERPTGLSAVNSAQVLDTEFSSGGYFDCYFSGIPAPPCDDVVVDVEAQSVTFENFTLYDGDEDIALNGTLYWRDGDSPQLTASPPQ